MTKLVVFLVLFSSTISTLVHAQQVDKIIFFGPGMSSSLTNDTKSVSAIVGAKLVFHFGTGGWFSQLSSSASFVRPQVSNASSYWSTRPTASLGFRFKEGKSRFALVGGFGEARNKTGDFLPTGIGTVIVKVKGRWSVVSEVSRNPQSWGATTTLGYRF